MVSRLEAFADNFKPQDNKFQRIDAEKLVAACSAAMQLRNRSALRSTVQGVFEKFSQLVKWTQLRGQKCFPHLPQLEPGFCLMLVCVESCGIVLQACADLCIC